MLICASLKVARRSIAEGSRGWKGVKEEGRKRQHKMGKDLLKRNGIWKLCLATMSWMIDTLWALVSLQEASIHRDSAPKKRKLAIEMLEGSVALITTFSRFYLKLFNLNGIPVQRKLACWLRPYTVLICPTSTTNLRPEDAVPFFDWLCGIRWCSMLVYVLVYSARSGKRGRVHKEV